ncbi:hypothetical protein KOSB73_320081 [Klebsiella grimontii]|uniref:Uncharacterized protein n=1 Tax=Klebsiella grimontii TaxID=2058152 RepID=A0A285B910_9ENTR|nr:hypothetical protein KOSB73_320081 [Klebsiella grimontii]
MYPITRNLPGIMSLQSLKADVPYLTRIYPGIMQTHTGPMMPIINSFSSDCVLFTPVILSGH